MTSCALSGLSDLVRCSDVGQNPGLRSLKMVTASHEIRRQLLLGRKAMTNLESVLVKSGNITLPTKVHIIKAMVFSVVTYGCEN